MAPDGYTVNNNFSGEDLILRSAALDALSKLRAEGVQAGDEPTQDVNLPWLRAYMHHQIASDRWVVTADQARDFARVAVLADRRQARSALASAPVAGARIVPTEPTPEMEQAAADYLGACVKAHGLWAAMLAAAPAVSAPVAGEAVTMKEICPDCGHQFQCFHNPYINQLRAAPQASEAVRNQALDDAEEAVVTLYESDDPVYLPDIALAIRALKTQADKDGGEQLSGISGELDCAKGAGDGEEAFEAWLYLGQTEFEPSDLNKDAISLAQLAYSAGRAALAAQKQGDSE